MIQLNYATVWDRWCAVFLFFVFFPVVHSVETVARQIPEQIPAIGEARRHHAWLAGPRQRAVQQLLAAAMALCGPSNLEHLQNVPNID